MHLFTRLPRIYVWHAMKFVKCLRAILLCIETGFLTRVPSAGQCLKLQLLKINSLPLCSLNVFSDIFSSPVFSFIYNIHTNTHTIVSRTHLFVCFLPTFILLTHLASMTSFLTPRTFGNEWPQRFGTPESKPQKPLRMVFWSVIANVFQTKLNISFSVFKTTLGSVYAEWGVGSINHFQNWFCA